MFSRPKICTFAVAIHAILRYTFKMEKNSQKSEESVKRKTSRFRTAALVVSGLLALIGYAGAVGLDSITIVPRWLPWTVGLILAMSTGLWGRGFIRRLTGFSAVWINYLIYTVVMTGVFACLLLVVNRVGAGEREPVAAEICRVYSETRHRTKRITSRRYTRGEPYKVYFAELDLGGGVRKSVHLNFEQYRKMRRGLIVEVSLRKGTLGFKVVDTAGMKLVTHKKADNRAVNVKQG